MCKKINVSQMGWMNMHNYYLTVGLLTKKQKYPRTQSNIQLCFRHTLAKKTTGSRIVFTYFRKASQIFVFTVMFIRDVHLHNWEKKSVSMPDLDAYSTIRYIEDAYEGACDTIHPYYNAVRYDAMEKIWSLYFFSSDRQQIINELVSSDF